MSTTEIFLLGIGLSMDAAAVSTTNAMVHRRNHLGLLEACLLFALMQGLMPALGYLLGGAFSAVLTRLGGLLVFFILGFIGYKMLREGLTPPELDDRCPSAVLGHRVLLMQAVATSIDALAVGVGFRAEQVQVLPACLLIALTTLCITLLATVLGRAFGDVLGKRAEIFGGVLLILIGIKAML